MDQTRNMGEELAPSPGPSPTASDALRKDEIRFRRVFDYSPIGVALITVHDRVLHANDAFCTLLGYTLDELRSQSCEHFTHVADRAAMRARFTELWEGRVTHIRFELRLVDKAGATHWVDLTGSIVPGDQGEGTSALVHIMDVTDGRAFEEERKRLLRKMMLSQSMFQGAIQSVTDGVFILDKSGTITVVNARAESMFGRLSHELIGHPISEFIPGFNRETLRSTQRSRDQTPVQRNIADVGRTLRAMRKEGGYLDVVVDLGEISVEGALHTIVTVRDVTPLRRSQRRAVVLSMVTEELATLFKDQLAANGVVDALVPEIADFAALQTFGDGGDVEQVIVSHRDPGQRELLRDFALRDPDGLSALLQASVDAVDTPGLTPGGRPERSNGGGPDAGFLPSRRLNLHSSVCVPLEARGHEVGRLVLGMTSSGRRFDIDDFDFAHALAARMAIEIDNFRLYIAERTQRRAVEDLLRGREITLANIADGVIMANGEGNIVLVNPAASHMLGLPETDTSTYPDDLFPELVAPDHSVNRLPDLVRDMMSRPENMTVERELALPGGDTRVLELFFSSLPANGATGPGVIVLLKDVTAARALEREREDFFANITHDLRNPLTAIRESIGVVLAHVSEEFPEPLLRMLVNSEGATVRMAGMVENLLDVSQMQQDRLPHRPVSVELGSLVNRAADIVEMLFNSRNQRLVRAISPEPVMVYVDPGYIERVVTNLLDNAHRYGREGGTVWIGVFEDQGQAVIRVADDGPGIEAADLERVFERNVRAGNGARDVVPGKGLGLAISRTFVEMEGGTLSVDSTPGVGSTFSIVLPLMDGGTAHTDDVRGGLS